MEFRSFLAVAVLLGTHSSACAQSSSSNILRHPDIPASEAAPSLVQGHDPRWWFLENTYPTIRYAMCNESGAQSSFYWHGANFGMFDRLALPDGRCAMLDASIESLPSDGQEPIEESDLRTWTIEFGSGFEEDFPTRIWCNGLMGGNCGHWLSRFFTRLTVPRQQGNETDAQTIVSMLVEEEGENSVISISFEGIDGVWVGLEAEGLTLEDIEVTNTDFQAQDLIPIEEVLTERFPGQIESNNMLALEVRPTEGATTGEATFVVVKAMDEPVSTRILAISEGIALFTFVGMPLQ